MDDQMKKLTLKLLHDWLASTQPDKPFAFSGGRSITPREYVADVENETKSGKELLQFLEESAQRANEPLATYLPKAIRPNSPYRR